MKLDRDLYHQTFDAAVAEIDEGRCSRQLRSAFYQQVAGSVFTACFQALLDSTSQPPVERLNVVSAPVGAGKTSFSVAFAAAMTRLSTPLVDAAISHPSARPLGCLLVTEQITRADELFRDLSALLPGKVAVWTTDHDVGRRDPTKVKTPAARFHVDDLARYPVAIVTHKFLKGPRRHKALKVTVGDTMHPRVLTIVDEQPDDVKVFDVGLADVTAVLQHVEEDAGAPEEAVAALRALTAFTAERALCRGGSLEKPSDAAAAWAVADRLDWFTNEAAKAYAVSRRKVPAVESVLGFAKSMANGYAFIARSGRGEGSARFVGYEQDLVLVPGMVLLDATADIDGMEQLCPWRSAISTPRGRYDRLSVVHVDSPVRGKLKQHFKMAPNCRAYVRWMKEVVTEHMEPGQKGLIVCHKVLFEQEHVPDWPTDDPRRKHVEGYTKEYAWKIGDRSLCASHWGTGIGDNAWKEADVVFLFDEFFVPKRAVVATVQGLKQAKATEGPLGTMGAINAKTPAVDILEEGHLLRWTKQMALRGNGRNFDEHGVCGRQKLVCTGSFVRLLANADRLFPGAKVVKGGMNATQDQQTLVPAFLSLLSRGDLPSSISPKWVSQQLGVQWRDVSSRLMRRPEVQRSLAHLGLAYVPGRGRGGGRFVRLADEARAAVAA